MTLRTVRRIACIIPAAAILISVAPFASARQASSSPSSAPAPKIAVRSARPKLVVVLVVDQMRADYVDKFRDHWTGGLKRLSTQGAWLRSAAYPYAETETCVGHATISTGALPALSGIISNAWWDRASQKIVTCTEDPSAKNSGYGGAAKGGDTALNLRVPAFADELKFQRGGKSRVFTFSLKARAAIMLAGHSADGATWFDPSTGLWTTSSAYPSVSFVAKYVAQHPASADYGKTWNLLLPASDYLYGDVATGSVPPSGWTQPFPHPLRGKPDSTKPDSAYYRQWETSPYPDIALVKLAETAVDSEHLGNGPDVDFLGVSFSSTDYVAHAFGPRSREIQDELSRLDLDLGVFFAFLDRKVGAANYVVALTADHGGTPIPADLAATGVDAGWLSLADVKDHIDQALASLHDPSLKLADVDDADVFFAPGTYEKLKADPAAMKTVIDAIEQVPGVARVYRADELDDRPATESPLRRAEAASFFAARSGDLLIVPKPYWSWDFTPKGRAREVGAMHGSPYYYDQRVPILFMGFGIEKGIDYTPATPADIAPTLAALCGITLAPRDGRILREILRNP
ncbi:MAG TPA: alkaline phosphatase family protein [Candidatus Limnocylindrales bacterium]|nr:alkaline phosphatase family protein [Candidatus Limnocylindrales bacterium]